MMNLNEYTPQQLQALANTSQQFVEVLKYELDLVKERLISVGETVEIHRLQGEAKRLRALQEAIQDAPRVLQAKN